MTLKSLHDTRAALFCLDLSDVFSGTSPHGHRLKPHRIDSCLVLDMSVEGKWPSSGPVACCTLHNRMFL